MKKTAVFLAMALIASAGLFAQRDGRGPKNDQTPRDEQTQEVVQASGNLAYVNGWIALQSGEKTYYLGGIQRLLGFVDGLKEGAAVKVEGYAREVPMAPEYSFLRLTKVTVNGKTYDIPKMPCMGDRENGGDCQGNSRGNSRGKGRQGHQGRQGRMGWD